MRERKKFYRMTFSSKDLVHVPEPDVGFLFACGHLSNEILSVLMYIIMDQPLKGNKTVTSFQSLRYATLARHILLKLFEFNDCYNKYIGECKKNNHKNQIKIAISNFSNVIKSINRENLAYIRNKFVGHVDYNEFAKIVSAKKSNNFELQFIFSDLSGEVCFSFSEDAFFEALKTAFKTSDQLEANMKFLNFSTETGSEFTNSCHKFMMELLNSFGVKFTRNDEFVPRNLISKAGEVQIPLFLEK